MVLLVTIDNGGTGRWSAGVKKTDLASGYYRGSALAATVRIRLPGQQIGKERFSALLAASLCLPGHPDMLTSAWY